MQLYKDYVKGDYETYEELYENFKIDIPENFNYAYDVLDVLAEKDPDGIAMVWTNEAGDERIFTFAEMAVMSNKTANYFKSLGVKKGDMVMLVLKRHYQFWFSILALNRLGAVTIPATNLLKEKDIKYRVEAANVDMIVCTCEGDVAAECEKALADSTHNPTLVIAKQPREGWHFFDEGIADQPETFCRPSGSEQSTNEDTMLLFFSSGTTGMPKMAKHSFTYPLGHIVTASFWQNVVEGGLHLTVADTGWGKAVWGKLYAQWMGGSAVFTYDYDRFDPDTMLRLLEQYRVTTFCAPPTIYRFFIREDLSKYDLSALTHCTIAGEALNPEVYNQWVEATGVQLAEAYGQTESTVQIGTFLDMKPVPGSMGKPAPGYDVIVVDDDDNEAPRGAMGEIAVRLSEFTPVGMFTGYCNDDALTQKALGGSVYRTGDMAWRDENGYFWYVGRADDVIKSSGYRIGPFEVESALMEHPAVLETAITSAPDPVRGQVVKATVVLNKGYVASEELKKELQDHVKRVTAPYKYPRIVEFVEELPKTISGKIRRMEIRAKDDENAKQSETY
ncbi:AMP-binding protein [Eubacteriales bacterium OttesenSCG-928-N14]|nr:AMP-binding protein [Eubacteriales bacterium OttesenSCG-928-N14]